MAEALYVKPREGGRIRQPERQMRVMPEDGSFIPDNAHYQRLLISGDVVLVDPPKKADAAAAPAEPKSEQVTETISAGRKNRRASQE